MSRNKSTLDPYPIHKTEILRFAWDKIVTNPTNPYPTYYSDNRYLIAVMALFTSHQKVYPVLDKLEETVAKILTDKSNKLILYNNFKIVKELCEKQAIAGIFTSPYYSQTSRNLKDGIEWSMTVYGK